MGHDSLTAATTYELGHEGAMGAALATPNRTATDSVSPPKAGWTFLTNHARVLLCVARQPGVRIRDVAQVVGVTERCVQRILADLEEAGYISRVHRGRRNHYEVHADLPLRHPTEQHQQVSALLKLMPGDQHPDGEVEALE